MVYFEGEIMARENDSSMKKVLMVTYNFPPCGGSGVQRILKFAKYLPQFSWQPVILTVRNGFYLATDHSLLDNIPPHVHVYRTQP